MTCGSSRLAMILNVPPQLPDSAAPPVDRAAWLRVGSHSRADREMAAHAGGDGHGGRPPDGRGRIRLRRDKPQRTVKPTVFDQKCRASTRRKWFTNIAFQSL